MDLIRKLLSILGQNRGIKSSNFGLGVVSSQRNQPTQPFRKGDLMDAQEST